MYNLAIVIIQIITRTTNIADPVHNKPITTVFHCFLDLITRKQALLGVII